MIGEFQVIGLMVLAYVVLIYVVLKDNDGNNRPKDRRRKR